MRQILASDGSPVDFHQIKSGNEIVSTCRNCVRAGAQIVVAAGGDGTINAVASTIVNTPATLAVIPAGKLNHFARDLSIPLDAAGAALELQSGREVSVDVGIVNGRIFINNSVLGIYPVYRAAKEEYERAGLKNTRVGRFIAVLAGMLRVFWRLPHLKLRLVLEGEERELRTAFVLIANNEHELEDWNIGRRRSLTEGRLWVYAMRPCGRWALLKFFLLFVFKRFRQRDAFDVFQVQELRIETKQRSIRVGVDGEIVRMQTPLHYKSLPEALHVIAPAAYFENEVKEKQVETA